MVIVRVAAYTLLVAAILFGLSGQLDWIMAWVYLFVFTAITSVSIYVVLSVHPGLVEERTRFTKSEGIKTWDKTLSPLMAIVGPTIILVITALDKRNGWSPPLNTVTQYGCFILAVAGSALTTWAMIVNSFFSSVARIQKERGHQVVDSGPYQFIRHPGYCGALVYSVVIPVALGSLWGLLPAGLTAVVIIARTSLEDKMLRDELAGYAEYAKRVRHRLVPGVW